MQKYGVELALARVCARADWRSVLDITDHAERVAVVMGWTEGVGLGGQRAAGGMSGLVAALQQDRQPRSAAADYSALYAARQHLELPTPMASSPAAERSRVNCLKPMLVVLMPSGATITKTHKATTGSDWVHEQRLWAMIQQLRKLLESMHTC